MMACLDEETNDRGLPQSPARLQAMKTFYKHKPLSVFSNQYRRCLPVLQHALSDFLNRFGIKGLAALHRNIDLVDCECLVLQHHRAVPMTSRMSHHPTRVTRFVGMKRNAPC